LRAFLAWSAATFLKEHHERQFETFTAVTTLIGLISDAKACARRLAELKAAMDEIEAAQSRLDADRRGGRRHLHPGNCLNVNNTCQIGWVCGTKSSDGDRQGAGGLWSRLAIFHAPAGVRA
jgi:hypothetical protein